MVWNDSTTVGCAWNTNCPNSEEFPSRTYFVCNYWPPGNLGTRPPGKEYFANVGNYTKWTTPEQVPDPPFNTSGHDAGAPSVNVTINGTSVQTITAQTVGPSFGFGSTGLPVNRIECEADDRRVKSVQVMEMARLLWVCRLWFWVWVLVLLSSHKWLGNVRSYHVRGEGVD